MNKIIMVLVIMLMPSMVFGDEVCSNLLAECIIKANDSKVNLSNCNGELDDMDKTYEAILNNKNKLCSVDVQNAYLKGQNEVYRKFVKPEPVVLKTPEYVIESRLLNAVMVDVIIPPKHYKLLTPHKKAKLAREIREALSKITY